MNFKV